MKLVSTQQRTTFIVALYDSMMPNVSSTFLLLLAVTSGLAAASPKWADCTGAGDVEQYVVTTSPCSVSLPCHCHVAAVHATHICP